MPKPFPFRAGCAALATALFLGGCSFKNPLLEDGRAAPGPEASAAAAAARASTAPDAPAQAGTAPGATPVASARAAAPAVQVTPPATAANTGSAAPAPATTATTPAAPVAAASSAAPSAPVASAATRATPPAAAAPASNQGGSSVQTVKESRRFGFLTPYRTDIQQGNFISAEMVGQLKPGMTAEQVKFVLGTPLLTDVFHGNRWDYVFQLKRGNGELTRSRLTLYFRDARLERWEGGDLPSEEDYLARIAGRAPQKKNQDAAPASPRAPSTANEPR